MAGQVLEARNWAPLGRFLTEDSLFTHSAIEFSNMCISMCR